MIVQPLADIAACFLTPEPVAPATCTASRVKSKAKVPKISDVRAPPLSDPRWADWSAPILEFLDESRTWEQLEAWRKETNTNGSLLRHCLAWLEEMGYARSFFRKTERKTIIIWQSNLHAEPQLGQVLSERPRDED